MSAYTRATCPDRRKHTPCPARYVGWHEWAERKAKTHRQRRCPTCGLYVIWQRKPKPAPVQAPLKEEGARSEP